MEHQTLQAVGGVIQHRQTTVRCGVCGGDGYITVVDEIGDDSEYIECAQCEAAGYVEVFPF